MKSGYSKILNVGEVSELDTDNPWLFLDMYHNRGYSWKCILKNMKSTKKGSIKKARQSYDSRHS